MALLGAMVLLALSAALVTGTFSAARALRRAALLRRAQARVETGVQRAFGEVLAQWSPALDSLPVASGQLTRATTSVIRTSNRPMRVRRSYVARMCNT